MFTPFGKICDEEYMWHTQGPKRGEPRGFAFVSYTRREDAEKAKKNLNGRVACGRPLVVDFVEEKVITQTAEDIPLTSDACRSVIGGMTSVPGPPAIRCIRSAKITAIQNKLRFINNQGKLDKGPGASRKRIKVSNLRLPGLPIDPSAVNKLFV